MRFNWRRRLVLTAFATATLLSLTGCTSQQEQQGMQEEVASQGQQQEGEGSEQVAAEEGSQQGTTEEGGNNAAMAEGESGGNVNPSNTAEATGSDVEGVINELTNPAEGGEAVAEVPINQGVQPEMANPEAMMPATEEPMPVDATAAVGPQPAPAPEMAAPSQPAAAVPGMPEMGSKMGYVVEPGDTLGKIAQRIYGDQKRWRDIANFSGLDNPNHIYPGDLLYYNLDETSMTFAQTYEGLRRGKEMVREGDTLAAIAKRVYGKSNLWKHIWRQNDNIDNPDVLQVGMTVYFIEAGSIKTAFESIKSMNAKVNKVVTKKLDKTLNLMTQAFYTAVPAV